MIDTFPYRLPAPASEGGFTLIEVLLGLSLAVVVFGATVAMLATSERVQARDTERAQTMQQGRVGLARMVNEIRQASYENEKEGIEEIEPYAITFRARIGTKRYRIKYACNVAQTTSLDECVRYATEGETLPSSGEPVVLDVTNGTTVFKYLEGTVETSVASKVNVVTLTIELPFAGSLKQIDASGYKQHLLLEDAAFLRNPITS